MALSKELLLEGNISLKEKYLSMEKEKRIRRMQFFERMLIPGILLVIFLYIPTYVGTILYGGSENIFKNIFFINIVFNIIYILIILKYYPIIIKKRAHDFGKDGKIETYILIITTIITSLINLYIYYLMINRDISSIITTSKYSNIISLIGGLVWLYLLFRPGTKGTNKYGEQKYYKLKFLG